MVYFNRNISFTFFSSVLATRENDVSLRLATVDFLVRIWRLNACLRLIFPVPVSENRFLAPEFVLFFGIITTIYKWLKIISF
jgi:hypothetical protein